MSVGNYSRGSGRGCESGERAGLKACTTIARSADLQVGWWLARQQDAEVAAVVADVVVVDAEEQRAARRHAHGRIAADDERLAVVDAADQRSGGGVRNRYFGSPRRVARRARG